MFIHRQRMEARTVVAVEATMRIGDHVLDTTLTNASAHGVLATVASPPPRGTMVVLEIGGHRIRGQVRWRGSDRCGIALKGDVSVLDLIEGRAVQVVYVPERPARRSAMELLRGLLG